MTAGLDDFRRSVMINGKMRLAAKAVSAMAQLLREAEVFPQGLGGGCDYAGTINFGNQPLCLEIGSYRAQVVIVEDTLTFQGHQGDGDQPQQRVGSSHLGITIRVDVTCDSMSAHPCKDKDFQA